MKNKFRAVALSAAITLSFFQGKAQLYTSTPIIIPGNNVGVGAAAPAFKLSVQTNNLNDGIQVLQTGASSAALRLDNSSGGGHNWGILSTSNGNSQKGGKLLFYDYDGTGIRERMVIDSLGNVGIGIPHQPPTFSYSYAPKTKLHIHNGSLKFTGTDPIHGAPNIFWGGNSQSAPSGEWALEYNAGTKGMNFWRPFGSHDASGNPLTLVNNVLFLSDNNLIGINTLAPTAKLEINALDGNKPLNILANRPDWSYGIHYQHQGASVAHKAIAVTQSGIDIFSVNTNGLVSIGNNGFNVPGLGIAAPPYSLVVGRGILTEKLKVALSSDAVNWSDYVFDADYKRLPVNEVEDFVKKNKHLPNIPSANEVYTNGLDVAQMDAALLRQIEELWLHVIDLKKENEALKKQLNK
jgi:hypothetical protein